jgi:hypothetical protein
MTTMAATIFGTCCGVGLVAVSAFLGVVLVFFFVALVGMVSDAVEWCIAHDVRTSQASAV